MIYITTALACEAKPLISHLRLKKLTEHVAFPCYRNDDVCLIVSGMGRVAMAAATAYIAASQVAPQENNVWLNVGVAGHGDFGLGTAILADKVVEEGSDKTWYPLYVFSPELNTSTLKTVDRPQLNYLDDFAYDMEGSAFIETASRFTSFELIHLFKVISDNRDSGVAHIDKAYVAELIESKLSTLEGVISSLRSVQSVMDDGGRELEDYECLLSAVTFSFSQQQQLRRLLQRYYSFDGDRAVAEQLMGEFSSAKRILKELEQRVDDLALTKS